MSSRRIVMRLDPADWLTDTVLEMLVGQDATPTLSMLGAGAPEGRTTVVAVGRYHDELRGESIRVELEVDEP